jgi:hypothetical protein
MREASPVPPPSTWGALNTEAYMIEKANLAEKLRLFSDHFAPRTVSQFNGHDVMVAKLKGPFVWHKHDDTDDFFLVLKVSRITLSDEFESTVFDGLPSSASRLL